MEPDTGFAIRNHAGETFLRRDVGEDSGLPTVENYENVFLTPKQPPETSQNVFMYKPPQQVKVMLPKVT